MTFWGIDPDRLQRLGELAEELSSNSEGWLGKAEDLVKWCQLEEHASGVLKLCQELSDEMGLLSQLSVQKVSAIIAATTGVPSVTGSGYQEDLDNSLDDGIGRLDPADTLANDPSLADIRAELEANPEFDAAWIDEKLSIAAAEGDVEAVTAWSAALWQRLEGMSDAEAIAFLNELGTEVVVTAIATAGVPEIPAVVDFLYDLPQNYFVRSKNTYLEAFLRDHYGLDTTDPSEITQFAGDKLLQLSRRSDSAADLVFERFGKYGPGILVDLDGQSEIFASYLRTMSNENPELLIALMGDDVVGQQYADLLVKGSTDTEISIIMNSALEHVAAEFEANFEISEDPNSTMKEKMAARGANDRILGALGKFDRNLRDADHGIAISYFALMDTIASRVPGMGPIYSGATEVINTVDGVITDDPIPGQREAQRSREVQEKNLALNLLAKLDPAAAEAIVVAAGAQESVGYGLTAEQWALVEDLPETARVHYLVNGEGGISDGLGG